MTPPLSRHRDGEDRRREGVPLVWRPRNGAFLPFRGNYGSEIKYQHPELGFNSRLDTLHAAVPNAKLKRLSAWNDQRRKAASHYHALLADCDGIQLPQILPENESV